MKKLYIIFTATLIVIGGIFMTADFGSCNDTHYKSFSSKDPELNVKMDYISDWKAREIKGPHGSFSQVQFVGKVKDAFAPSIVLTVESVAKTTVKPPTVNEFVQNIWKKRTLFKDAKEVSRSSIEVNGVPAVEMTITYLKQDKLRDMAAKSVSFKERIVVFQSKGKFYTLRYVAPEQNFAEFEQDFASIIKTFSLK